MISFVSLFLGLVAGAQAIAVQVAEPVARVGIYVDGQLAGQLDNAPWRLPYDFGPELAPHKLEALAYDDAGSQIGKAQQWVNLPRQPVEATVVLERDSAGRARAALLTWESLAGSGSPEVRASLDGEPLAFQDPHMIPLPPHDPNQLHFLRAELIFEQVLSSVVELTFGGAYADRVSTELTAVPVVLEKRQKIAANEDLQTWFTADGNPVRVAAAEQGPAAIIVVRDRGSWRQLQAFHSQALSSSALGEDWFRSPVRGWKSGHSSWTDWTFQFVWPISRRQVGTDGPYDLFPHSPGYSAAEGSLHGWASWVDAPADLTGPQRLADALAIAGLAAAAGNHRRAVLLILGDRPEDASHLSPALARRYLEHLHVPLFVWSVSPKPIPETAGWIQVVDASSSIKIHRASRQLTAAVEQQRILWLDGRYLPQKIRLTSDAQGVRLTHEARR
jgi:hypothetical protein